MNNIKKGDKVKVLSGKDKGKEGVVERVWPKKGRVLVAGVNIFKKHSRPRPASQSGRQGNEGGIINIVKPLPIANVALVCPKCHQATRVAFRMSDEKTRICKKCQEAV